MSVDFPYVFALASLFSLHCISMWTIFCSFSRTPLLLVTVRELLRRDFAAIYCSCTTFVTFLLMLDGKFRKLY